VLGERPRRRRSRARPEPFVLSASRLQDLLGLSDEELLQMLDAGPLEVVSGELDHRPELPILLDLLADAEERAGAAVLRRWVRAAGPAGRPIDLLLARDFAAFEDALGALADRGFVISRPGPEPSPPATSR
jgi:hypothetical protein